MTETSAESRSHVIFCFVCEVVLLIYFLGVVVVTFLFCFVFISKDFWELSRKIIIDTGKEGHFYLTAHSAHFK